MAAQVPPVNILVNIQAMGWRLVQFESGDIGPPSRIGVNGIKGRVDTVHMGDEALRIKELLDTRVGSPGPRNTTWQWMTRTPGVDVTAVFDQNGRCIGASLGFLYRQRIAPPGLYKPIDATYVTLITTSTMAGIGRYLRHAQIRKVNERLQRAPMDENPSLQVISLSALPTNDPNDYGGGRGAVGFQQRIFEHDMEFTRGLEHDARLIFQELDRLHPELFLREVMEEQPVQPLRFIDD